MSIRNTRKNFDELPLIVTREGFAQYRDLAELNEKQSRLFCGWLASSMGRGGQKRVSETLGVGINTVRTGMAEFEGTEETSESGRIRRQGGGRKATEEVQPGLKEALQILLEELDGSFDGGVLHWSVASLRDLKEALSQKGFLTSHVTVGRLLGELGYRKIQNRQMPRPQPRRDEQFRLIELKAADFLAQGDPVISIVCPRDTDAVEDLPAQDFLRTALEKMTQTFDMNALDKETTLIRLPVSGKEEDYVVDGVDFWCGQIWRQNFPKSERLLIVCEGIERLCGEGESHWKKRLITLANKMDREITVCFAPSGTMKWSRVAHRLVGCVPTKSSEAKPVNIPFVVSTVAYDNPNKRAKTIKVDSYVDFMDYLTTKFLEEENGDIVPVDRYGAWNYEVRLRKPKGPVIIRYQYDLSADYPD